VGVIVFLFGIIGGFGAGGIGIVVGIIFGIVGGFLAFASLYAFAQFIYVIIDIERNTRTTARALLEEVEEVEPEEEVESE